MRDCSFFPKEIFHSEYNINRKIKERSSDNCLGYKNAPTSWVVVAVQQKFIDNNVNTTLCLILIFLHSTLFSLVA